MNPMNPNSLGVFHPAQFPVPQQPVQTAQAVPYANLPGNPIGPGMGLGVFHPSQFPIPQQPVMGAGGLSGYNGLGCITGGCGCATCGGGASGQPGDMLSKLLPWLVVAAIAYWLYKESQKN